MNQILCGAVIVVVVVLAALLARARRQLRRINRGAVPIAGAAQEVARE